MPRLSGSIGMATPSVEVSETTGVLGNYVELLTASRRPHRRTPSVTIAPATVANGNGTTITVTGGDFPIGDAVDAVECDTACSGSFEQLRHNKSRNQRYGRRHGARWSSRRTTKIMVLTTVTSPPYTDSSSVRPAGKRRQQRPVFRLHLRHCERGDLECLPVRPELRHLKSEFVVPVTPQAAVSVSADHPAQIIGGKNRERSGTSRPYLRWGVPLPPWRRQRDLGMD